MASSRDPIRVMVADDSATIRGLLAKMLNTDPDVEVVCTAANGELALAQLGQYSVDVILLDVEMPVMDGIAALPQLRSESPETHIIMVSSLTRRGADVTLEALSLGASDFIQKPTTGSSSLNVEGMREELLAKIKSLGGVRRAPTTAPSSLRGSRPEKAGADAPAIPPSIGRVSELRPEIVAIGSSTGGPNALVETVEALNRGLQQPIVITQHMPPVFTRSLARRLSDVSGRPCKEGEHGEPLLDGHMYVAPGGYHMTVAADGDGHRLFLNQDDRVNFCRPAVDVMFDSVARSFGSAIVAVVLTGMGRDGRDGCKTIRDSGGVVVIQDQETSVVWGMPGAVHAAGLATTVLPINKMGSEISRLCLQKVRS